MLTKHIEKIQQKSNSYKKTYSMTVSVFVTLLIASVWALSAVTLNGNQVAQETIFEVKDISPASVIKTGATDAVKNIFSSDKKSVNSMQASSSNGVIIESGDDWNQVDTYQDSLQNVDAVSNSVIVPNE